MPKISVPGEVGERVSWDETYTEVETEEKMLRWVTTHHPMMVPLMKCARVLEVGTGTGVLSGFLAKTGVSVTSLDLSQPVLNVAAGFWDLLGVKVTAVCGDGTKLNLRDDSFDAVFSQGLWEHFSDEAVRQFAREGLRVAPVVYASIPSALYPRVGRRGPGLVGNERFLTAKRWMAILAPLDGGHKATYYADWKLLTFAGVTVPYPNHLLIELRRRH
jgi:protein-L-isoaspartate O-methyltransferase